MRPLQEQEGLWATYFDNLGSSLFPSCCRGAQWRAHIILSCAGMPRHSSIFILFLLCLYLARLSPKTTELPLPVGCQLSFVDRRNQKEIGGQEERKTEVTVSTPPLF